MVLVTVATVGLVGAVAVSVVCLLSTLTASFPSSAVSLSVTKFLAFGASSWFTLDGFYFDGKTIAIDPLREPVTCKSEEISRRFPRLISLRDIDDIHYTFRFQTLQEFCVRKV